MKYRVVYHPNLEGIKDICRTINIERCKIRKEDIIEKIVTTKWFIDWDIYKYLTNNCIFVENEDYMGVNFETGDNLVWYEIRTKDGYKCIYTIYPLS